MATEAKTVLAAEGGVYVISWSGLGIGDDGDPAQFGGAPDRSVQVFGTFGAAGAAIIQGSNDGANWFTLSDPLGGALSFTAAGGKAITELTRYVRPLISGGDGTTNLSVYIAMRSAR